MKSHINDAQSRLKPCQCGCDFVNISTWYMDPNLRFGQMYVLCSSCHKRTKAFVNPYDAQRDWNSGRTFDEPIKVSSDKQLIENCIAIITTYIEDYNDMMQLEGESQVPLPKMSMWKLVQELLLYGTTHAGRATSIQKAQELGFNPYKPAFPNEQDMLDDLEEELTDIVNASESDYLSGEDRQVLDDRYWDLQNRISELKESIEQSKED